MASEKKILNVEGMSCMHCQNTVKKSVGALQGVSKVEVDLQKKKVIVELDQNKVKINAIKDSIEGAGYHVE